jgi:hypothetical protein
MLHCHALSLPDIARGAGTLELVAALPDDFEKTWLTLGGDPSDLYPRVGS